MTAEFTVDLRLSPIQAAHRKRLMQIREEAVALAGTALKLAETINEVLEKGGALHIQPQVAYITGATARINKDWGVVEHLQTSQNATQRKVMR